MVALFFGQASKLFIIAGMGVVGLAAYLYQQKQLRRMSRFLARLSPSHAQHLLLWLEEWDDRPDVAAQAQVPLPAVPLRGAEERFSYPAESVRVYRYMAGLCVAMVLFTTLRVWGEQASTGDAIEFLVAFFGAGAIVFAYLAWRGPATIVVTSDDISLVVQSRVRRGISWADVKRIRRGSISGAVIIDSAHGTLAFSDEIQGFGRLYNLAVSCASRRRAV